LCLALQLGLALPYHAQANGWRSDGTGVIAGALPVTRWSAEQNLIWTTEMPSWSNATPVVVGDRLFALSEPTTVLAVDTRGGEILWSREVTYLQTLSPSDREQAERALSDAKHIRSRIDALHKEARLIKGEIRQGRDVEGRQERYQPKTPWAR